jgi:hypothetical protein
MSPKGAAVGRIFELLPPRWGFVGGGKRLPGADAVGLLTVVPSGLSFNLLIQKSGYGATS